MNRLYASVVMLLLLATPVVADVAGGDFKVDISVAMAEGAIESTLYFIGGIAIEVSDGAVIGLSNVSTMSWWHEQEGDVPLAKCEAWAEASTARTMQSLGSMPDGAAKDFTRLLFAPGFTTELDGKDLVIRNSIARYRSWNPERSSLDRSSCK